jgi:predicted ATPase
LTADNAAAVAQICERLDGIPPAIEPAAARVRGLSVGALAAALDDRFRLLTSARTVLARQRTLQASVDWRYNLLDEAERALFCRLAIFAGSFDLDAAAAVAAGPPLPPAELLEVLLGLVDKSMVTPVEASDRYRMLETLRQYGQTRLADTGKLAEVMAHRRAESLTIVLTILSGQPGLPGADRERTSATNYLVRRLLTQSRHNERRP